ncbi:MAG: hypothetical protein ACI4GW_06685 [Lachnospiraceae bacterium]
MKDMGKGNIYQICKKIRMNGIVFGIALIVIWALLYLVLSGGSFTDIFYGVNRVYLFVFLVGIGLVVVNVFCILTRWDKRIIQKLALEQGIFLDQLERNMDDGIAFCQKGGSDIFFISSQFSIVRSHGFWQIIRTENIMKLGVDRMERGQVVIERMHCLMKDGTVYTVAIPNRLAMVAAEYLKGTLTSGTV